MFQAAVLPRARVRHVGHKFISLTKYFCSTEVNECNPNPCQNGADCVDLQGAFQCNCPPGFQGSVCDFSKSHTRKLQSGQCLNTILLSHIEENYCVTDFCVSILGKQYLACIYVVVLWICGSGGHSHQNNLEVQYYFLYPLHATVKMATATKALHGENKKTNKQTNKQTNLISSFIFLGRSREYK